MRTLLTIAITALVVGGGVAYLTLGGADEADESGPVTTVIVEEAATGALAELVTAPGEVRPARKVAISARISARIAEIPVAEGQTVTAGGVDADGDVVPPTLLVRLDATELQAALDSAEARRRGQEVSLEVEQSRLESQRADLVATHARLGFLERDLERKRAQGRVLSEADLDEARVTLAEHRARIQSAEHGLAAGVQNLEVLEHNLAAAAADIAKVRDDLSYASITSPLDGVVTKIHIAAGELTVTGTMNNPGTVILEVADLSRMVLYANVDEADIGAVAVGQLCEVRIHAYPDRTFPGTVEAVALIAAKTDNGKSFEVDVLIDTSGERIYSGLTADVDIVTERHEGVLRVPSQAVLGRPADAIPKELAAGDLVDDTRTITPVVYRLLGGKAVVTPVRIGSSDATHTLILEGLAAGDPVIVGPYKVLDGLQHEQAAELEEAAGDEADGDKDGDGEAADGDAETAAAEVHGG